MGENPRHGPRAICELASSRIKVIVPLKDVIKHENELALFKCVIEGVTQWSWYRDGTPLHETQNIRFYARGTSFSLEIKSVTAADRGMYNFFGSNTLQYTTTFGNLYIVPQTMGLRSAGVAYLYSVPRHSVRTTQHIPHTRVRVGEPIVLQAGFLSDAICFWWTKCDKRIVTSERISIGFMNNKTELRITEAVLEDSGLYQVACKTRFGVASTFNNVLVLDDQDKEFVSDKVIPSVEETFPEEVEYNANEDCRIVAKVNIDQNTTMQVYNDEGGMDRTMELVDYGDSYVGLRWPKTMRCHSSDYTLQLQDMNTEEEDNTSCIVTINIPPRSWINIPTPVRLLFALTPAVAAVGAPVCFECAFDLGGCSHYYTVWHVGHYRIERSNNAFHMFAHGSERLLYIDRVESDFGGEVVCELRLALPRGRSVHVAAANAYLTIASLHVIQQCLLQNARIEDNRAFLDEGSDNRSANGSEIVHNNNDELEDGIILEVVYCRLERDGFYFSRIITSKLVNARIEVVEKYGDGRAKQIVKCTWNKISERNLYTVEIEQDSGVFVVASFTTDPSLELTDPPVGRIIHFRVRLAGTMAPHRNSDVAITVLPTIEDVIVKKEVNLKDFKHFDRSYHQTGESLGSGAFGAVNLVAHRISSVLYAAKHIKTRTIKKRNNALREYEMMCRLQHPKLVQLHDAFYNHDNFIYVMEYLWGGELFERIINEDHLKEADVVPYVRQILEALEYLHSQEVAHLDIKPENIVCISPNSQRIKLIDFGLARELRGTEVKAIYGTKDYVAPEVLNFEKLTFACDMWSMGVVTYMLLSGTLPFDGENWHTRSVNIARANYDYDDRAFDDISEVAKDFVDQLLVLRAADRMTAAAGLNHPWVKEGPPEDVHVNLLLAKQNLRSYLQNYRLRWQRAGNVMIAAHRLRLGAHRPTPLELPPHFPTLDTVEEVSPKTSPDEDTK